MKKREISVHDGCSEKKRGQWAGRADKRRHLLPALALLMALSSVSWDLYAFETGDDFVPDNFASRLMRRYEQMDHNEHVTYPVRVFNMEVSNAQATALLEHLSVVVSYMTESMYGHYGFMVKSVTFTLDANGAGPSTSGDPMPLNIELGEWWSMGYRNNQLGITEEWTLNPELRSSGLYHEFSHHFLLRHLDAMDGHFPRSTMDMGGDDVPAEYLRWGGDDLVGAIHMWRYTVDSDTPHCPEFYTLKTIGVTRGTFPDAEPYPEGTWRCDPDRTDRLALRITNKADGSCLGGRADGTDVLMGPCNPGDNQQRWDFVADDDGSFRIKNVATENCLRIRGNSLADGTVVEQHSCKGADSTDGAQKFYPIADGSGHYSLRAELSGRVVESGEGTAIQMGPNGASSQRWTLSSCGNARRELGEACEQDGDCPDGEFCSDCLCEEGLDREPLPGSDPDDATGLDPDREPNRQRDWNPGNSADPSPNAGGCGCMTQGRTDRSSWLFIGLLLGLGLALRLRWHSPWPE
jgi:hypothetical protein